MELCQNQLVVQQSLHLRQNQLRSVVDLESESKHLFPEPEAVSATESDIQAE